jgi:hypothetical protein
MPKQIESKTAEIIRLASRPTGTNRTELVKLTAWSAFAFPYFLKGIAKKRGLKFSSPAPGSYLLTTKPARAAAARTRKAPKATEASS